MALASTVLCTLNERATPKVISNFVLFNKAEAIAIKTLEF